MLHPETASDGNFPLGIPGFRYGDLYDPARLSDLSTAFWAEATHEKPLVMAEFRRWQGDARALTPPEQSEVVLGLAPILSGFVGRLFGVEPELRAIREAIVGDDVIFWWKREVVTRRIVKNRKDRPIEEIDAEGVWRQLQCLLEAVLGKERRPEDLEWSVAMLARVLDDLQGGAGAGADGTARTQEIAGRLRVDGDGGGLAELGPAQWFEVVRCWARVAMQNPEGFPRTRDWVSFHFPKKVDFAALVELRRPSAERPQVITAPEGGTHPRDGFKLTDHRKGRREVLAETDYCIFCHPREKDSCSRGLLEKDGTRKKNPLGTPVTGCPLQERISEAHQLKAEGDPLAALATVMMDNPMVPGTGHRICNDCMKGCIFQNQDPVDIPQAETAALTDVLALPWGAEIYLLLTRWNPLHPHRPQCRPYHGHDVLVVGLGPAGYTLAHHLAQEGFGVAAVDGLKLEPLPAELIGGPGRLPKPIERWADLWLECDERPLAGFGGVSEYGITVRWDKNFLTLIHLSLARRTTFRAWGGVRFGGTVLLDDAWRIGFHHVAIATGAGKPTIVEMENNLAPGIRKASDFLMALQLTGAGRKESVANLQVRLPALVIGGGLTGIDTATELLAYYPIQVEKTLDRWETLVAEGGEGIDTGLSPTDREMLAEFLAHGQEVRAERARALAEGRTPDFLPLLDRWGGVHLVYRRSLLESPAYRLNHEEVHHALAEGIRFAEGLAPKKAHLDASGWVEAVEFVDGSGASHRYAARTVCVAAGTAPNVIYEKEHPGTFTLDARKSFFQMHVQEGDALRPARAGEIGFFTSYDGGVDRRVTVYGDNHPTYAGSVVRAMASAKDGHAHVVGLFAERIAAADPSQQATRDARWLLRCDELDRLWSAQVVRVVELTPTIVEVVVRAPAAARHFEPGQFYRLHDFEADTPAKEGTRLQMEGLALTGAWVDKNEGLLSVIALEMGGSSRLLRRLRPGQPVVVMGPTGAPTHIAPGETVALLGGGLGNAVLFSIGRAFRARGAKVVYFAGYRNPDDVYKIDDIEAASDQVIWCCDRDPAPTARRAQDRAFVGNIVAAMLAYCSGALGPPAHPGEQWDRIIAIGSDRMMAAVKAARHGVLAPYLTNCKAALGSINSPMQCMLKEVCAQCLQKHRDPATGKESFVFTCFDQDQPLDRVDFPHLADRLRQNRVQEHVTDLWVRRALRRELEA
jgi:NADPH-dependent glutamate synthase beta subunit-like oxidoreductase/NAD(P)H-flavin reductase